MLYVFKFPDIGEGIHEGKILKWHVKKGQTVSEGDAVVNVETDKVVTDIPIPKDGVIKNLFSTSTPLQNGSLSASSSCRTIRGRQRARSTASVWKSKAKWPRRKSK